MPQPSGSSGIAAGSSLFSVGGGGSAPTNPTNTMDYGSPINFQRTSARVMFQPSTAGTAPGSTAPGFDFGDIVKITGDLGPDEQEVYTSQNGFQTLVRMDVAKLKPVFTISCHEFVKDNLAVMFAGTDSGQVLQASATASTLTLTNPKPGSCWDLGLTDLTAVSAMVSSTPLVLGVDYDIDPKIGFMRFLDSSTLVTGSVNVTVTYSVPAITFEGFTAFTQPNVLGWITIVITDSFSKAYRMKIQSQTILSAKKMPDFDVAKFTEVDLTAALLGTPIITFNAGVTAV